MEPEILVLLLGHEDLVELARIPVAGGGGTEAPGHQVGGHLTLGAHLQAGVQENGHGVLVEVAVGHVEVEEVHPRHSEVVHIPTDLPDVVGAVVARFGLGPPAESPAAAEVGLVGVDGHDLGIVHITGRANRPEGIVQTHVLPFLGQSRLGGGGEHTAEGVGGGLVVVTDQDLGGVALLGQHLARQGGGGEGQLIQGHGGRLGDGGIGLLLVGGCLGGGIGGGISAVGGIITRCDILGGRGRRTGGHGRGQHQPCQEQGEGSAQTFFHGESSVIIY